jgi:hypothetical protein
MIAGVTAEIDARFGAAGPVTVELGDLSDPDTRGLATLRLDRPIDTAEAVTIVETDPGWSGGGSNAITLSANDYRIVHGGRTLQRLLDGDNGRTHWAPLVHITYTPLDAQALRDEAVIRIMALDTAGQAAAGLKSERAGDYSWTAATGTERAEAREAVFTWLGMALRGSAMPMA